MNARIIVSTALKGGAGKTTIAMQIAGTLALRGYKVLVADADRQGTASRWAAAAEDGKPFPAVVAGFAEFGGKVHRELVRVAEDYEFIVVDCPPAEDSPVPQSALLVADLALVPVVPSPLDIWSSTNIRERIEHADVINEGIVARSRLVLNMVQPNTTLARDTLAALEDFGIPLAASFLSHRQTYRQSATFGATVHTVQQRVQNAVHEVDALTDEVLTAMDVVTGERVATEGQS